MAKKSDNFDYTKKVAELDSVLARLQAPDIELDEATRLHAVGLQLVEQLEKYLHNAENEVRKHTAEQ